MIGSFAYGYAGWFVLDVRLLIFVFFLSALFALGTASLLTRDKPRSSFFKTGWLLFGVSLVLNIFMLNVFFDYPVFRIESFFPIP